MERSESSELWTPGSGSIPQLSHRGNITEARPEKWPETWSIPQLSHLAEFRSPKTGDQNLVILSTPQSAV